MKPSLKLLSPIPSHSWFSNRFAVMIASNGAIGEANSSEPDRPPSFSTVKTTLDAFKASNLARPKLLGFLQTRLFASEELHYVVIYQLSGENKQQIAYQLVSVYEADKATTLADLTYYRDGSFSVSTKGGEQNEACHHFELLDGAISTQNEMGDFLVKLIETPVDESTTAEAPPAQPLIQPIENTTPPTSPDVITTSGSVVETCTATAKTSSISDIRSAGLPSVSKAFETVMSGSPIAQTGTSVIDIASLNLEQLEFIKAEVTRRIALHKLTEAIKEAQAVGLIPSGACEGGKCILSELLGPITIG